MLTSVSKESKNQEGRPDPGQVLALALRRVFGCCRRSFLHQHFASTVQLSTEVRLRALLNVARKYVCEPCSAPGISASLARFAGIGILGLPMKRPAASLSCELPSGISRQESGFTMCNSGT